jgi:hypothetical protein
VAEIGADQAQVALEWGRWAQAMAPKVV